MGKIKDFFSVNNVVHKTIQVIDNSYQQMKEYFDFLGTHGTTNRYLKAFSSNPLVFMVINRIASVTASMPISVKDSNGNELSKSIVLDMLNNPNQEQSSTEFREEVAISYETTGNAYVLIEGSEYSKNDSLTVLKPATH